MIDASGPISTAPHLRIEELFVEILKADATLADIEVVAASDRGVNVPPLHVFVLCDEATPVLPGGQNYRANVAVTLVTNMDDYTHDERKAYAALVNAALTKDGIRPFISANEDTLIAWTIKGFKELSDDQTTADNIVLSVAAAIAG